MASAALLDQTRIENRSDDEVVEWVRGGETADPALL